MLLLRFALTSALLSLSSACSSSSSFGGPGADDASVLDSSGNDAKTDLDAGQEAAGEDAAASSVRIQDLVYWQKDPSKGDWPWISGHLVNDSTLAIASVSEIDAWFEGGTPRTFPTANAYSDLYGLPGGQDLFHFWFFHITAPPNDGNAAISGSFNSSGAMSVNVSDGPLEPYAVGMLHVVMKGNFEDGTPWQTAIDCPPTP